MNIGWALHWEAPAQYLPIMPENAENARTPENASAEHRLGVAVGGARLENMPALTLSSAQVDPCWASLDSASPKVGCGAVTNGVSRRCLWMPVHAVLASLDSASPKVGQRAVTIQRCL